MKRSSRLAALAAGLLTAALVATCSTGGGPVPVGAGLTVGVDVHGEMILPIDNFTFTTDEAGRSILATTLLTGECLHDHGYPFDPAAARAENAASARVSAMDVGEYGNKRRYGVTDAAVAARYGYHLVSVASGVKSTVDRQNPHGLGDFPQGAAGAAKLQAVTDCQRAAEARIAGGGAVAEASVVAAISHDSFDRSLTDPAVVAAFAGWSACMKAKGYDLAGPDHITGVTVDSPTVPPAEVAMAEADVVCKQRSRVVETWFDSEATYQRQQIEQHAGELEQARRAHDDQMARVTAIVAGGS
jgi:hypothetical protein